MKKKLSLKQECKLNGANFQAISGRIEAGLSKKKAFSIPSNPPKELIFEGIILDLKKFCKNSRFNYRKVLKAIYIKKLPLKKALALAKAERDKSDQLGNKKETNLKAICIKRGLSYHAVYQRIVSGWSVKDALETPINSHKKRIIDGKEVVLKDYCKKHKLDYKQVQNRLFQKKLPLEEALDLSQGKRPGKFKYKGKLVSLQKECLKQGRNYDRVRRFVGKDNMTLEEAFDKDKLVQKAKDLRKKSKKQ